MAQLSEPSHKAPRSPSVRQREQGEPHFWACDVIYKFIRVHFIAGCSLTLTAFCLFSTVVFTNMAHVSLVNKRYIPKRPTPTMSLGLVGVVRMFKAVCLLVCLFVCLFVCSITPSFRFPSMVCMPHLRTSAEACLHAGPMRSPRGGTCRVARLLSLSLMGHVCVCVCCATPSSLDQARRIG